MLFIQGVLEWYSKAQLGKVYFIEYPKPKIQKLTEIGKIIKVAPNFYTLGALGQKSTFQIFYPNIHIYKIPIFTKFTFLKSQFSQNSLFWNLIFDRES